MSDGVTECILSELPSSIHSDDEAEHDALFVQTCVEEVENAEYVSPLKPLLSMRGEEPLDAELDPRSRLREYGGTWQGELEALVLVTTYSSPPGIVSIASCGRSRSFKSPRVSPSLSRCIAWTRVESRSSQGIEVRPPSTTLSIPFHPGFPMGVLRPRGT